MVYERNGQVECSGYDNKTAVFTSYQSGTNENEAIFNAGKNIFENLFNKGVPDSSQEKPMVEYSRRKDVQSFVDSGEFEKFIMYNEVFFSNNNNGVWTAGITAKIDMNGLRKHLIEEGIIKQFGL